MIFSRKFLHDAAERVMTTVAEVVLGFTIVDGVTVGVTAIDWKYVGAVCATAAIAALAKSVLAASVNGDDSASLSSRV